LVVLNNEIPEENSTKENSEEPYLGIKYTDGKNHEENIFDDVSNVMLTDEQNLNNVSLYRFNNIFFF